ncbi:MAG TPA: TetR/AcrR family transcriptional regulator [Micromonosporaceae bacterium]|jgi:AcrR family transcriptional regulator
MKTERTGTGDPVETLRLLWPEPSAITRRGPRPSLTIDAIVESAIELADAGGLDSLTMRQVAEALGVAPMTLYTYVPGKAELLDLMLDSLYASMGRTDTSDRPWRDRVTAVAEENAALFVAHPWAATISTVRPPLGPGQMTKYEHELRALDGIGLDDVDMDATLTYVLGFVQAIAVAATDARTAVTDSAMDDGAWWAANAPLLARVFDENAYPLAARVGAAAGAAHAGAYNAEHAYRFGLSRIIDGIDALIRRAPGR